MVAEKLNQEKISEFDLDTFMAIAKIRSDEQRSYSESMFKYINSFNKYERCYFKVYKRSYFTFTR